MLALERADSIRFLYRHFLSTITDRSLNAFYYVCSHAKIDYTSFMNVTASMALKWIPKDLGSQPVFLCIDDTMVPKSGKNFEDVSKLFDHAAHNGSHYLNGHCFVSVLLCVPVWNDNKICYQSVPLGYRIWEKNQSKLKLAASMVRQVMPEFHGWKNVIILCDSWYVKKELTAIVKEYQNLDLIGNARSDSVMYDLAPQPTRHRGRPTKHRCRLSIEADFILSSEKIDGYYIGSRQVLTNISGEKEVMAYVTCTKRTDGSRRLFFSTISPQPAAVLLCVAGKSPFEPDRK